MLPGKCRLTRMHKWISVTWHRLSCMHRWRTVTWHRHVARACPPAGQRRDALSLRPLLLSEAWGLKLEGALPDHWRRSFVVPLVRLLDLQMVSEEAVMSHWASKAMSCKASIFWAPLPQKWAPRMGSSLSLQLSTKWLICQIHQKRDILLAESTIWFICLVEVLGRSTPQQTYGCVSDV